MLEVQDQTNFTTGYFQIIQNLPTLNIGNSFYCFSINNNTVVRDQIRNIISYFDPFVHNIESGLLSKWNIPQLKFNT